MLDLGGSPSRNCSFKTRSDNTHLELSVCEFDVSCGGLPELSGEKDWRSWGRGGRAPDLKATSTSGEDTTHM